MPRIRILQAVAGLDFSWTPGEIVDMTAEQAGAWNDGFRGELVDKPSTPERSARPETPERSKPDTPEVAQPERGNRQQRRPKQG